MLQVLRVAPTNKVWPSCGTSVYTVTLGTLCEKCASQFAKSVRYVLNYFLLQKTNEAKKLTQRFAAGGPLAQLVERHVYTVNVIGSIPVGPTK